ncbi:MAG: hypothetical protein LKK51_01715 [Eubacterium sp.]|jgi:hypothetical protein|uniref:hypothetical protein n=1 Tax=Eubacterium sp. F2 TaxID=3381348 RepID=UPI0015B542B3|nr:hypothetical protein [Eubacterium sp.]MCH4006888.1 hypothetical protein [Eubacterium sp.]MCH4047141.1 hypothetical protein [Eubacterium sp.]MCH4080238.1 hypothetical protein [Eubacterium sp.]MCH4111161.1 hypothetical protein [Eubacterium sp.]
MSKEKEEKKCCKSEENQPTVQDALKAAGAIVGIGLVAGFTLVMGMNKIMKEIFVNDDWPDEEWSSDDWAGEDLD